jgi:large subunit ribosomal protein L29
MAIDKVKELSSLSNTDLQAELESMQKSYQMMNFEHAVKGLEDPLNLRAMRRNIARVNTEIRRREIEGMSPEQLANRTKIRNRRRGR